MSAIKYVATAHPSSSIQFALKCDFCTSGVDDLIVCKQDRIEVYALEPNGLRLSQTINLYGTVICIQAIKLVDTEKANLLVLTAPSLQLFELSYSPNQDKRVITTITRNLKEPGRREAMESQGVACDPLGRCAAAYIYEGELQIFPANNSHGRSSNKPFSFDLNKGWSSKLPELNISNFKFLSLPDQQDPLFTYIHPNKTGMHVLHTCAIKLSEKELIHNPIREVVIEDYDVRAYVNVKSSVSDYKFDEGVLVAGEAEVTFVAMTESPSDTKGKNREGSSEKSNDKKITAPLPIGEYNAICALDDYPDYFVLGDSYGLLVLVHLQRTQSGRVSGIDVQELGNASSAQSLVYLVDGFLFIGSHFGDSQLIKIPVGEQLQLQKIENDKMDLDGHDKDSPNKLEVINNFINLAPIADFVIVEADSFGSNLLVACSGALMGGCIRLVRHGVGMTHLASLDMENVQKIWSLKLGGSSQEYDDVLAMSFVDSSSFLSFTNEESIEDISDSLGFETNKLTIEAGTLLDTCAQVTNDGIYLYNVGHVWSPDEGKKITIACIKNNYIVLGLEDQSLIVLKVEGTTCNIIANKKLPNEISSLDLTIQQNFSLLAVGLWTSQKLYLFNLDDLEEKTSLTVTSSFLIRSIQLVTFQDSISHLFIGLGDGNLINYTLNDITGLPIDTTRKSINLGNRPISMHQSKGQDGQNTLFVTSDKPTIVSRNGGRLNYSSVNLQMIQAHTKFHSKSFINSIAFVTNEGVQIGRIDDVQKLHIRTLSFAGPDPTEPRRISYNKAMGCFAVVCLHRKINRRTGKEDQWGTVKLLQENTFDVLNVFELRENEVGYSITTGEWKDGTPCFFIGTGYVQQGATEASSGRVIVLDRNGETIGSLRTTGSVHSLLVLENHRLVTAVNSFVTLYSYSSGSLESLGGWGGTFIAWGLASPTPSLILVADALRSCVLLSVADGKLVEVSREYSANAMMAVESLEPGNAESGYIGAEQEANLFTLERQKNETGHEYLEMRGKFHLGDLVNRFRLGSLESSNDKNDATAIAKVSMTFATSSGSIGVICDLGEETASILSALERNMRNIVGEGIGSLKQVDWRTFKTAHHTMPPAGFIDGTFVETFLDFDYEKAKSVMNGTNEHEKIKHSYEEVIRVLEELARLH